MSTKQLLDEAMKLKPEERFTLVEGLIKSLDEPDKKLDDIWAEEAGNGSGPIEMESSKASRWKRYLRKNDARHVTSDAKQ